MLSADKYTRKHSIINTKNIYQKSDKTLQLNNRKKKLPDIYWHKPKLPLRRWVSCNNK